MIYIRVDWLHSFDDEPVLIYSQLDEDRNEVKKIEVYRNGRVGYATATTEHYRTGLSQTPLPELEEIASDPQFRPAMIGVDEFEAAWSEYVLRRDQRQ